MNILTKELIDTYSLSTMNESRYGVKPVKIKGREYLKTGDYQAVTLVGNVFKIYDPSTNLYKRVLMIGVGKQHPSDFTISKETAYEAAQLNAWDNPQIVMEVGPHFNKNAFCKVARAYIDTLDLKFVKTKEEGAYSGNYYNDYYTDFKKCFPSIVIGKAEQTPVSEIEIIKAHLKECMNTLEKIS